MMNFHDAIRTMEPDLYYRFEGSSPFVDHSRNRVSNLTTTDVTNPVAFLEGLPGTLYATQQKTTATIPSKSRERFTVVAAFKPNTTNLTNVVSFTGDGTDGLYQSGPDVSFTVKHGDSSTTTVSTQVDPSRMNLVSGVFSKDTLSLYVNGVVVNETSVSTTSPAVVSDSFKLFDTDSASVAMVAVFYRAIKSSEQAILSSYQMDGLRNTALNQYLATNILLSPNYVDRDTLEVNSDTPVSLTDTYIVGSTIYDGYTEGTGNLGGLVEFNHPVESAANGVRLSWGNSAGATFTYSLDGSTFFPISNQTTIYTSSPTDQFWVKIDFDPSVTSRQNYVENVMVEVLGTDVIAARTPNGRDAQREGEVSLSPDSPTLYSYLPSTMSTTSRLVVIEDADDTETSSAVEVWYTPAAADLTGTKTLLGYETTSASMTVVSNKLTFSGYSAVYVNGVSITSGSKTLVEGVPYHIMAVHPSPFSDELYIGNATNSVVGKVSAIALLPEVPDASAALNLFNMEQRKTVINEIAETGYPTLTVDDVIVSDKTWTVM